MDANTTILILYLFRSIYSNLHGFSHLCDAHILYLYLSTECPSMWSNSCLSPHFLSVRIYYRFSLSRLATRALTAPQWYPVSTNPACILHISSQKSTFRVQRTPWNIRSLLLIKTNRSRSELPRQQGIHILIVSALHPNTLWSRTLCLGSCTTIIYLMSV